VAETSAIEVTKTIVMGANSEIVFKALTDDKELIQWLSSQRAFLEQQIVGAWMLRNCRFEVGKNLTIRGKILQIINDRKLSLPGILTSTQTPGDTTVAWTLKALNGGTTTQITLVHSGLVNDSSDLNKSWSYFIGGLAGHGKQKQQHITSLPKQSKIIEHDTATSVIS
jgi:uncharacterized protein YndB with AHSA1/START domain